LIGVLTAILSPIGLIIIAAGLLGAAWAEDWGGIQEKTAAVWAVIQPLFETIKIWLQINIPIGLEGLRAFWVNVAWPAIQNAVQTAWPIILALFTALVNFISNTIVPITMDFWRRWTTEWWPAIQKTVQTVWPVIQGIFQALITFITGTIVPTVATLQSNWSTSWTAIQTALQNVWRIIEGVFTELGRWINDNIIPWVKYLYEQWTGVWWPQIQSAIEDMWKVIQPIFDAIRAWMEEKLPPALDKIQAAFSTGMTAIQNAIDPVKKAWDGIVSAVQGFWTWITSHTFKFTISLPDLPSWARPPGTGKAGGGSVWPGQVYRVGEHGEEWFVPNVPGQIISNSVLRSFTAALNKSGGTASGMTTSLGTQKVQSTVNQYYLTANYAYQNEASLASDIRTLEMMHRSSL
jgi:phage-related protein